MHLDQDTIQDCWRIIQENAPESISWNHYDLAQRTEQTQVDVWKTFLLLPEVIEWSEEEQAILQRYELAKLSTNVARSRSVGQAQLISAMDRLNNNKKTDTNLGPAFIYTYVPLNDQQMHAPNVVILKEDIFFEPPEEFKFDDSDPT